MELVKVQIPQATTDPNALALVYDKDRMYLVPAAAGPGHQRRDGRRRQGILRG